MASNLDTKNYKLSQLHGDTYELSITHCDIFLIQHCQVNMTGNNFILFYIFLMRPIIILIKI